MIWPGTALSRVRRRDPLLFALIITTVLVPAAFGLVGPGVGRGSFWLAFWIVLTALHVSFGVLSRRVADLHRPLPDQLVPDQLGPDQPGPDQLGPDRPAAGRAALPSADEDEFTGAARRMWRVAAQAAAVLAVGDAWQIVQTIADPLGRSSYMGTPFQVTTLIVAMTMILFGLLRFPGGRGAPRLRLDVATVTAGAATCGFLLIQVPPGQVGLRWALGFGMAVLIQPGVFLVAVFAVAKLFLGGRSPFTRGTGLIIALAAALQAVMQASPEATYLMPYRGSWLVAGNVLSSALLVLAARVQERHHRGAVRPASGSRRPYSWLPYGAMVVTWAFGVGALAGAGLTWRSWLVIGGAMVTTALVVTRQMAAFRHIAELLGERDALTARLTEQAYHDALTGLANRALFMNRLTESLAGGPVTVFLIDLDQFKPVNDSFGHATGDRLLIEVGERLRRCVRSADTVARLGGDEFAVLVDDLDRHRAAETADGLRRALSGVVQLGEARVTLRASVGMAIGHPGTHDPDTLLHEADMAMYAVKNSAAAARR